MRPIVALMVLALGMTALAQEPSPSAADPYAAPAPPPQYPPAQYPPAQYPAAQYPPPQYPPPQYPSPQYAASPYAPSSYAQAPAVRMTLSRSTVRRWRGARVMNGFAGAIGLISGGLSVSSSIYVAAAHYPPSLGDFTTPRPSDPAQVLSYVSSASAALAFGLSAGGLAIRHHILRELNADTGRGLFIGGTVVGVVGIAAIAVSYIVGFSNVGNPHDQSIAVLSTSLGGSAICNVATAMYARDAENLQRA